MAYDPEIPFLGIYLEKMLIQKDTCTSVFMAALFTMVKTQKQPKYPSTDEWIRKMWYICTTEYYSAIKNNEIIPFVAMCLNIEMTMRSKLSQRNEYHDIPYVWNLKYDANELIYKTETHRHRK